MFAFNSESYGPAGALLDVNYLPELGPGAPNASVKDALRRFTAESLFDAPVVDHDMARACLAGLWLAHNFLDDSHTISQEIHTPTGSYWHGIMHRREGDFSNAKYWFRRVGEHPIFEPLADSARQLANEETLTPRAEFLASPARWDPYRFIDLCEATVRGQTPHDALCRRIAREEWRLLFDYCYRRALGQS